MYSDRKNTLMGTIHVLVNNITKNDVLYIVINGVVIVIVLTCNKS